MESESEREKQTVEVEVDAEFITQLGDALRRRDESIEEFVSESCWDRLTDREGPPGP